MVELGRGGDPVGTDLAGHAGLGPVAGAGVQDADGDLATGGCGGDDDLCVDGAGRGDRLRQRRPVGDLGHATGTAGRADHDGQAEPRPVRVDDVRCAPEHHVGRDGQAGGDDELAGEVVVHGDGRGEDARPDIGQVGHLQQPLMVPSSEGALQDGEDHVDAPEVGDPGAGVDDRDRGTGRHEIRGRPTGACRGAEHPATLPGHPDRHYLNSGVEGVEEVGGADAGHGVLGAAAAEHDGDPGLLWRFHARP